MSSIYKFAARLQDGFKHLALSRHPVFTDAVSIKLKSGFHIRMPAATLGCNRDGEGKKRKSKNREAAVPFLPADGDRAVVAVKGFATPQRTRP